MLRRIPAIEYANPKRQAGETLQAVQNQNLHLLLKSLRIPPGLLRSPRKEIDSGGTPPLLRPDGTGPPLPLLCTFLNSDARGLGYDGLAHFT